jgi:hypothetical protein
VRFSEVVKLTNVRSAAFFLAEHSFSPMAPRRSKRVTELRRALWLSLGLALVMFSFALVAKHYMMG